MGKLLRTIFFTDTIYMYVYRYSSDVYIEWQTLSIRCISIQSNDVAHRNQYDNVMTSSIHVTGVTATCIYVRCMYLYQV